MDGISASSDAAKYSVTFSGKCDENGKTVQLTKKNGKFCATANVSADHMDELIVATLKKDGKVIGSYSYKVKEYLDSVSTYGNDELAALVNTVKTYGSVSKAYFNTPDSMPAVSDYSEKYSTAEFEPKKDSSDMISLVLDSKLAARLYVDGLTATGTAVCGSDTLKAKKSASGEYYFEVKGIDPTELADDIVIKYNEKEYVFKPLSWCYLVSKNNAGGRNQVMADMLYEYYTNAAAYKNTLY